VARPSALIATALLIAALAIRVVDVQQHAYRPVNDAGIYLRLASEIAHLGSYSTHDRGAGGTMGPSAYFPPAYPYFLAAVDVLTGHETPAGAAVHPARLAQTVLGTLTVALIGLLALELFGPPVALIALGLAAVYPVLVELSGLLVAENLLTPLVLAATWAALRARRARTARTARRWIATTGVLTGLAALAHENGILLLLPLAAAVWTARPRWSWRALAAPALLIAVAALTIAPWTVRNAIVLHRLIPVSDETGITLVGTYNSASAANRQVPYKWRLYYGIPQDRAVVREARVLTEPELDSRLRSQALDYITNHPFAPFAVLFHNTLRLFELEGSYAWHASAKAQGLNQGVAGTGVTSLWILSVLALLGALTGKARQVPRWLWAIPVLLGLSVVLVNVETPRFREPVEPFLILLAACAVASGAARLRRAPVRRDGSATASGPGELVEVVERLP
jgi:4-amino-4-deoxy-L-arabinose transferase-like glycosyltransferase